MQARPWDYKKTARLLWGSEVERPFVLFPNIILNDNQPLFKISRVTKMVFNTKFVLLALVAVVAAQSSSAPNGSASVSASAAPIPSGLGITPCIINCVQPAATKVGCALYVHIAFFSEPST